MDLTIRLGDLLEFPFRWLNLALVFGFERVVLHINDFHDDIILLYCQIIFSQDEAIG